MFLRILELFWQVVLQVTIGATLARRVGLIALRPHGHNVLNAALDNCIVNARHAKDKLEQIPQLFLLVVENVLESKEVNGLVCVLSNVNPVLEPGLIAVGAPGLKIFPVRQDVSIQQIALKLSTMALSVSQVKE